MQTRNVKHPCFSWPFARQPLNAMEKQKTPRPFRRSQVQVLYRSPSQPLKHLHFEGFLILLSDRRRSAKKQGDFSFGPPVITNNYGEYIVIASLQDKL